MYLTFHTIYNLNFLFITTVYLVVELYRTRPIFSIVIQSLLLLKQDVRNSETEFGECHLIPKFMSSL